MIYLDLFLTFLKIGGFSFGGGYGMISMIREECFSHNWLTESELMNFIAVSESTPGPIAINMATFIGYSQGKLLGSFLATLGVILPSFVIILLIASVINNLLKYKGVQAAINGIKPVIVGLITATGLLMLISTILGIENIKSSIKLDLKSTVIFAFIILLAFIYKKIKKKAISPIILIITSGILGILLFK